MPIVTGARYRLPSGSVIEVGICSDGVVHCAYVSQSGDIRTRHPYVDFVLVWLQMYGVRM